MKQNSQQLEKYTSKFGKSTCASIALILLLAVSTFVILTPNANAQPADVEYPSFLFASVNPNPVGVGQQVLLVYWTAEIPTPETAEEISLSLRGAWYGVTMEIVKPDGTTETVQMGRSDPVGGGWVAYYPDQMGTYTIQANLPEQWRATISRGVTTNRYYSSATSETINLVVTEEPLQNWPDAPLPDDYWTRPVDTSLRSWSSIAGNWLNDANGDNKYTTAPETAHIVWTKPQTIGGLTGGDFGTIGYYEGSSYERKWGPVAIIDGRFYYRVGRSDSQQTRGTMAVDLRTGEELFFMNRTSITGGMIYDYSSPNQHGTIPYLLASGSVALFDVGPNVPTYSFYDPFTGEWLWTVTDRPSGTSAVGPNGEALVYQVNMNNDWMALWNSTASVDLLRGSSGTNVWQWRPVGKTVNGTTAYNWNVTIPDSISGSVKAVLGDIMIGGDNYGSYGRSVPDGGFTVWAMSLKPGQEGQLLWNIKPQIPSANVTLQFEGSMWSLEERVFVIRAKETRQWYCYDLDTGALLWGPTEPQPSWQMYSRNGRIHDGKLYAYGYAGLYCYDITTGEKLWEFKTDACGLEGAFENWPISGLTIADEKIYLTTGEHSHDQPIHRGWSQYCVDAETGEEIWSMTGVWNRQVISDGYMVTLNGMDNQIYCFGKGQTATTVTGPELVQTLGTSVLLKGTITDQSAGAKDTPAIADEDMTDWMNYLYRQFAIPDDAKGVEVKLSTIDPNGNTVDIGTATSNTDGAFGLLWTPDVPGQYEIIATFEGSDSYFSSYATTYVGVSEALETPAPEATPAPMTDTYLTGSTIAILAGIAVAVFLILRKK